MWEIGVWELLTSEALKLTSSQVAGLSYCYKLTYGDLYNVSFLIYIPEFRMFVSK